MVRILIATSILLIIFTGCTTPAKVQYPTIQETPKVNIDYYYPEYGYGALLKGVPMGTKVVILFPEQYQAIEDELITRRNRSNQCKEVIDNHNRSLLGKMVHKVKVKLQK